REHDAQARAADVLDAREVHDDPALARRDKLQEVLFQSIGRRAVDPSGGRHHHRAALPRFVDLHLVAFHWRARLLARPPRQLHVLVRAGALVRNCVERLRGEHEAKPAGTPRLERRRGVGRRRLPWSNAGALSTTSTDTARPSWAKLSAMVPAPSLYPWRTMF